MKNIDLNRRDFLKGLAAVSVTATAGLDKGLVADTNPENKRAKNVLLLFTDDQSAHLECLGTKGISTPATNELAEKGIVFTNAFSTSASCSPARSGILTGMYPHSNGHWRNTHSPTVPGKEEDYGRASKYADIEPVGVHEDLPTLVEILNSNGIVTAITAKFHLSPVWKYPFNHRLGATAHPESHYDAAKKFFADCKDQPFFMMANIINTHRPFRSHIVDIDVPKVDSEKIDIPANLADTDLMRKDFAEYLDTVQCADACAGEIIKALKESGKYDDTLIIFTSDQGYCYHRAKATCYDKGIRVPFIISGPGVNKKELKKELINHIDVMPTVLDFWSIDVPEDVQGRSLWPLLKSSEKVEWREYVFAEHNAHGPGDIQFYPIRSVNDGRFHFILNLTPEKKWEGDIDAMVGSNQFSELLGFAGPEDSFQSEPWGNNSFRATIEAKEDFPLQYKLLKDTFSRPAEELYDLHTDSDETRNIASCSEYKPHLDRLKKELINWMKETNDPGAELINTHRRG